ncbi:hypothetical protein SOVF_214380, partial [Spinacia oleracea]
NGNGNGNGIYFGEKCYDEECGVDLVRYSAQRDFSCVRFDACKVVLVPKLCSISKVEVEMLKSYLDSNRSVIIISQSGIWEAALRTLAYQLVGDLVSVVAVKTDFRPCLTDIPLTTSALVSEDGLKSGRTGFVFSVILSQTSLILNNK